MITVNALQHVVFNSTPNVPTAEGLRTGHLIQDRHTGAYLGYIWRAPGDRFNWISLDGKAGGTAHLMSDAVAALRDYRARLVGAAA